MNPGRFRRQSRLPHRLTACPLIPRQHAQYVPIVGSGQQFMSQAQFPPHPTGQEYKLGWQYRAPEHASWVA